MGVGLLRGRRRLNILFAGAWITGAEVMGGDVQVMPLGAGGQAQGSGEKVAGLSAGATSGMLEPICPKSGPGPLGCGADLEIREKVQFWKDLGITEAYWKRLTVADVEEGIERYWAYRASLSASEVSSMHRQINRFYFAIKRGVYQRFISPTELPRVRRKYLIPRKKLSTPEPELWFRIAGVYVRTLMKRSRAAEDKGDYRVRIPPDWLKGVPGGDLKDMSDEDRGVRKFIDAIMEDYPKNWLDFVRSYEKEDHIAVVAESPVIHTLSWFEANKDKLKPSRNLSHMFRINCMRYWPKPLSTFTRGAGGLRGLLRQRNWEKELFLQHGASSGYSSDSTERNMADWMMVGVTDD